MGDAAYINLEIEALHRRARVVARVRELTGGRGADLILDPIGGKGFGRNFDMLAPLGMVLSGDRM